MFHQNILKYQPTTRLYKGVDEMNWELVKRHNAKVGPDDEVWFLGDFSFGKLEPTLNILDSMHGIKHLIKGNHDQLVEKNDAQFMASSMFPNRFRSISDYGRIKHKHNDTEYNFVLFHYPILVWDRAHHGSMMLHGHSHGSCRYPFEGRIMDVGVDCHPNNEPFALDEIIELLKNNSYGKHHER